MLECVINVSEGRRADVIDALTDAAGRALLDVHTDAVHHRSVFTLAGQHVEHAARSLAAAAVETIDLRAHAGVHPRLGAVDVVPFVPLPGAVMADAVAARDRFSRWFARTAGVPCFRYGAERTLPDIRRHAFDLLAPDDGPPVPHPTAGACCVGARTMLVAYNLWLARGNGGNAGAVARSVAAEVRGPAVRALGLVMGDGGAMVSMNLLDPLSTGPAAVYDAVASRAEVARAELVGLLPAAVLDATPRDRWASLDLAPSRTIEARLEQAGLDGGRFPAE